jgi:hypothetical protein
MRALPILLAIAFVLSGFAGMGQAQDGQLILRIAMQDDIKTTNPLTAGDGWTWNVLKWIYEPATLRSDPAGQPGFLTALYEAFWRYPPFSPPLKPCFLRFCLSL